MIFSEDSIKKIVAGKKTQTRRPVKAGEQLLLPGEGNDLHRKRVVSAKGTVKMSTVQSCAVQPGRGKLGAWWLPATGEIAYPENKAAADHLRRYKGYWPLRIWVTNIRREDVRDITCNDAIREGFPERKGFWETWCGFYDAPALDVIAGGQPDTRLRWELIKRPNELYQAWVYEFHVATVW